MNDYKPTDDMLKQIETNYTYHSPKGTQPERYELIRAQAKMLALTIVRNSPPSRNQSLALTKLEECIMHTNAAIARNE